MDPPGYLGVIEEGDVPFLGSLSINQVNLQHAVGESTIGRLEHTALVVQQGVTVGLELLQGPSIEGFAANLWQVQ